jgi:hypothetical protein
MKQHFIRSEATVSCPRRRDELVPDQPNVVVLEEVVLTVWESDSKVSNEHRGERLVCKWTDSAEGWLESAEKVAAMLASYRGYTQ